PVQILHIRHAQGEWIGRSAARNRADLRHHHHGKPGPLRYPAMRLDPVARRKLAEDTSRSLENESVPPLLNGKMLDVPQPNRLGRDLPAYNHRSPLVNESEFRRLSSGNLLERDGRFRAERETTDQSHDKSRHSGFCASSHISNS